MKLYYFNPNDYGEQAFVAAESKEQAKQFLLNNLKEFKENPLHSERKKQNHEEKICNMVNEKGKYTIDEHEVGSIVFSEIC